MTTGQLDQAVGFIATAGQVKRVVRLNIGLNNNPYGSSPVSITNQLSLFLDIDNAFVHNGQWEGQDEPTLVVTALTTDSFADFEKYVEQLTQHFTQQAIAFKYGGKGVLTYDPSFDGERYEFNDEYFI